MVNRERADGARIKGVISAEDRWRRKYANVIERLHAEETTQQIADALEMKTQEVRDVRRRLRDTGEVS